MINLVYQTLSIILNKENYGYVSPTEFNNLANMVQLEIFEDYFSKENKEKNKENKGFINSGISNIGFNVRQKLSNLNTRTTILAVDNLFTLPNDLFYIHEDGITDTITNKVIEEIEEHNINYIKISSFPPSSVFPVYERYGDNIEVLPETITSIDIRYIRKPKTPKWTYTIVSDKEFFNPSAIDYQDFELHSSEFTNIVLKLLSYFGLNIREQEVITVAETLKDKITLKDNQ